MDARMPDVGEVLVHRFRRRKGEVHAQVVSVDHESRSVTLRINGVEYSSLSAAAKAVAGSSQNGWVYWGLKKQAPRGRTG